MLPEKVTDPIRILMNMLIDIIFKEIDVSDFIISENAINEEANPPRPLNIATIWGIEVIWTFLAKINPIIPPIIIPEEMKTIESKS